MLGQHSTEVLGELGYTDSEIDELLRLGVARDAGRPAVPPAKPGAEAAT